jgi:hypothetical protein
VSEISEMKDESSQKLSAFDVEPLDELDNFWLDTMRDVTKNSITSIEDAAKQLIPVISILQAIYFAAISFSNLKASPMLHNLMAVFLFVSPIICWFVSLAFAISVFIPRKFQTNLNSPSKSSRTYDKIAEFKQKLLWYAYIALLIGFVPLLVCIAVYLYFIPAIIT